MSKKIDTITFSAINKVEVKEFTLPECGPEQLLCETLLSFVSPGTELRVLSGDYSKPEDFPLIPGYSAIARVVEVGSEVRGYHVGDLVSGRNPVVQVPGVGSMWGGQASHHLYASHGEDRAVLIPRDADPMNYAIAEVAAVSFRGIEAARAQAGETAVVIGQGMIGSFSAAWLMDRGCKVIVCDIDEGRLDKALERGVAAAIHMKDQDALQRLEVHLNGGADIVVESSGVTPGLEAALKLVRKKPQAYGADYKVEPINFYGGDWPRLVLQANYIEKTPLDLFSACPGEGVTLITPMDRGVEDRQKVIEAIRMGRLKSKDYIDKVISYREAANGYKALQEHTATSVVFQWQ